MSVLSRALYQAATGLALLAAGPVLLARRGRHYLPTLPGRLGRYPPGAPGSPGEPPAAGAGPLWIHAVSVGEVGVAATLAKALPAGLRLLVTTVTPTGQERARAAFAGRAEVAYLPFDLGFAIARFFRRFAPRALVLVEGDYWPLLLSAARRRDLPVAVVNGRVSDRSFGRLVRVKPLLAPLFAAVERFGVQTEEDRERLVALGVAAERVAVTGNLKYESPEPQRQPQLEAQLAKLAGDRPILVAGSTMPGEEPQVLAAFERAGGGPRAMLVLAPRHPERFDEVDRFLVAREAERVRRSWFPGVGRPAVVLLDSVGELAALYRLASAAFIGGTLVPTGGHNPLEAARFGVPLAVGPSMHNFREMAEAFDRAGGWRRVIDGTELGDTWGAWLDDPAAAAAQGARAARLVDANRGALARTLELLAPLLGRLEKPPGPMRLDRTG